MDVRLVRIKVNSLGTVCVGIGGGEGEAVNIWSGEKVGWHTKYKQGEQSWGLMNINTARFVSKAEKYSLGNLR